nr:hypothetical protein [Novosphingobium clariflavum]
MSDLLFNRGNLQLHRSASLFHLGLRLIPAFAEQLGDESEKLLAWHERAKQLFKCVFDLRAGYRLAEFLAAPVTTNVVREFFAVATCREIGCHRMMTAAAGGKAAHGKRNIDVLPDRCIDLSSQALLNPLKGFK